MPIDVQSAVLDELLAKLAVVPDFGARVVEDFVLRIIDSDDDTLPDDLIVIQSGDTEEVERIGPANVRERVTLNITLITRRRMFAGPLRAARLAIKATLAGTRAGLQTQGITECKFLPDSLMPSGQGRAWSARVMPLQITYQQMLK